MSEIESARLALHQSIDRTLERNSWKPNRKQARLLAIPFTIKEAALAGGAGSGKTDVLIFFALVHKFIENSRFKQLFLRRTFPEIKNEVLPRTKEIFPKFGATLNQTDMIWTFPRLDQYGARERGSNSGAMFKAGHCEHEKDVHQYDSMEISLFTPDEMTTLTEYIYLYIMQERNRAPRGSGLPSITRGGGVPGGIGHKWFKKRFVDPAKEGDKIIIGKAGVKRIFVRATQADNKENIDPTYEQSLQARPEAEKKAKLHGDFDAYQGMVFDEFRERRYPDEPENALHCIQPFDIPEWWPRYIIGDWGYVAMCHIGFFAISPTRRLYLYRELAFYKTKIEEWAPAVKYFIDKEHPRKVKFCQSAKQERGQNQTIHQQLETALNMTIDLTVNSAGSRVARKMNLHEYLRWKQKPIIPASEMPVYDEEKASWLLRNKGIIAYNDYLNTFNPPEPETNLPKLQIFMCEKDTHEGHPNCCPLVVEAIKAANYDEPQNDKPAEDVKEFDGDDPYDVVSYACDEAEDYFIAAKEEFEKVQKQAKIIEMLEKNLDWTAFYRNMERQESHGDVDSTIAGIPRYRH